MNVGLIQYVYGGILIHFISEKFCLHFNLIKPFISKASDYFHFVYSSVFSKKSNVPMFIKYPLIK